jgi:hypothetical protein
MALLRASFGGNSPASKLASNPLLTGFGGDIAEQALPERRIGAVGGFLGLGKEGDRNPV